MDLYIIRHADALALGERGVTADEERPLSDDGHKQAAQIAAGLKKRGVELELLLTSPLVRARQTAEALRDGWGEGAPPVADCPYLAPGAKKRKLLDRLREQHVEALGLVGHNPDLSELVGWLVGSKKAGFNLEKAGVACVEFEGAPGKGCGSLAWVVTPSWCDAVAGPAG